MGEYIIYQGEQIKIGTRRNLYYASYFQYATALHAGDIRQAPKSLPPEAYILPDSGFRFRFPFPDEDRLRIGDTRDDQRGVPVKVPASFHDDRTAEGTSLITIELIQQKLVQRGNFEICLAVVYRLPGREDSFRIDEEPALKALIQSIIRNHVMKETKPWRKAFYRELALRTLKGYRLRQPSGITLHRRPQNPIEPAGKKKLRR